MTNKPEYKANHEARQKAKGFEKIHDMWVPPERKPTVREVTRLLRKYPDATVEVHIPDTLPRSEVVE